MQDKKHLKVQGIRFARSLQTLLKMVNMFSADHKSTSGLLQRTYELLNPLVKQSRCLTLGFIDQRMLLNNILTVEESVKPLENEFLKRGIGAVTFDAGITLTAFREAIACIGANAKVIEQNGGLLPFLEQRKLEFVRIFPASKTEKRNEEGDTILEMGSEEYLISKALTEINGGFSQGIDAVLSHMETAANSGGVGGVGSGTGFGGTGNGFGTGNGIPGSPVAGYGPGTAIGALGQGFGLQVGDLQRMAEQKFEAFLKNPEQDPQTAYVELAKMLQTVRPDVVLNNLVNDGKDGNGAGNQELTAEVFEDSALRWAMKKLAVVPAGDDAVIVEEQIFRVLMRSLHATHAATRLAKKLAEMAKEYALPPQVLARIEAEVRWLTLTPHQKLCELLAVTHFSSSEFRRCLELIKEFLRQGEPEQAMALGLQYFSIFDNPLELELNEVARVPEILRALAGTQGEFWHAVTDWLTGALASRKLNPMLHFQIVNGLATLARIAATYEQFDLVQKIGLALDASAATDPSEHQKCCSTAVSSLMPPSAVDRITEMFFERRNDSAWTKLAANVLRWAGPDAIERIFIALDNEVVAVNRLGLIRLLARLGPSALVPARKRLQRTEWYVVRNACKIIGELKDPELLQDIQPVFGNKDERVQKAALQAIIDSHLPGVASALAAVLPQLSPVLLEEALYELMFLADPDSLPALERCFASPLPAALLWRLVSVVAAIQTAEADNLLTSIMNDPAMPQNVSGAAKHAMEKRPFARTSKPAKKEPTDPGMVTQDLGYAGA
ncbi:MAG TPA: HEAT repeat domain-containing protein [Candidatus Angelobacter sp.]|nr:HEAT repeat domain-containing protein [Candidatus Angelobacter sp.]